MSKLQKKKLYESYFTHYKLTYGKWIVKINSSISNSTHIKKKDNKHNTQDVKDIGKQV